MTFELTLLRNCPFKKTGRSTQVRKYGVRCTVEAMKKQKTGSSDPRQWWQRRRCQECNRTTREIRDRHDWKRFAERRARLDSRWQRRHKEIIKKHQITPVAGWATAQSSVRVVQVNVTMVMQQSSGTIVSGKQRSGVEFGNFHQPGCKFEDY